MKHRFTLTIIFILLVLTASITFYRHSSKQEPNLLSAASLENKEFEQEIQLVEHEPATEADHQVSPPTDQQDDVHITLQQCENFFLNSPSSRTAQSRVDHIIASHLKNMEAANIPRYYKEVFGDIQGLNRQQVFHLEAGLYHKRKDSEFFQGNIWHVFNTENLEASKANNELTWAQRDFIKWLAKNQTYDRLFEALENNELAPNQTIFSRSILGTIIDNDDEISLPTLKRLVQAKFPIFLDTIGSAILNGLDLTSINYLLSNYQGDIKSSWGDHRTPKNLALVAAHSLEPELFSFFVSKGIPAAIRDYNAFEAMPAPTTNEERNAAKMITLRSLELGLTPRLPSSFDKINEILSDEQKQNFKEQLLPPNDLSLFLDLIKPFNAALEKEKLAVRESQQIEDWCLTQYAIDKASFIDNHIELFKETKSISLENKTLLQEAIYNRRIAEELKEGPPPSVPVSQEVLKAWNTLNEALINPDIDLIISAADTIFAKLGDPSIYTRALKIALNYRSKNEYAISKLSYLLDRTPSLPDDIVLSSALYQNWDLFQLFLEKGMNVHHTNVFGQNAYYYAVKLTDDKRAFDTLINLGVNIKPNSIGKDPLDFALEELMGALPFNIDIKLHFASELIKNGAPIEKSHIEAISLIAISSPATIDQLLALSPSLGDAQIPIHSLNKQNTKL